MPRCSPSWSSNQWAYVTNVFRSKPTTSLWMCTNDSMSGIILWN